MKKVLSLILVVVMLVACLAGCGGTGGTTGDSEDPLASRGLGEAATDLPSGIMLTKVVAELIPQIITDIDKYLDGDYTDEEAIEVLNEYRSYDFSMAQTHDVETKKILDRVIKLIKDKVKDEAAAAEETEEVVEETTEEVAEGEEAVEEEEEPSPLEEILEKRNRLAEILELEIRDAI